MATIQVRMHDGSFQPMSYPDNWNDDQVKSAITKHFPQDNDNKIQDQKGWSSVLSDALSGIGNVPNSIIKGISNAPSEIYGAATTLGPRGILNLGGGVRKGLEGAINIPSNIADYFGSKGIGKDIPKGSLAESMKESPIDLIKDMRIPESDLEKSLLGQPQAGDSLLQGIGSFLPYGPLAGTESGLAGMTRRAATGATYGVGQNQNPITNALLSLVGEGTNKALSSGSSAINSLRPSNLLRGNATPEQLQRNLKATEGTETNLGDVTESPLTKEFYENFLAKLPFSGASKKLAETGRQITNTGQNLVDSYLPENVSPNEVSDRLGEALIEAKKNSTQEKEAAYKIPENLADQENLKLELPKFSALAKKHLDAINSSTMLQYEPEVKSLINRLTNYTNPTKKTLNTGNIVDTQGNPIINETETKYPRLKEANMLAGRLNELANKNKASLNSLDRQGGAVLGQLGSTLKNEIKSTIANNGSKALQDSFQNAEDFYRKNFSKFLDKDLFKFTEQKKPADDLIATFLQNSRKSDKAAKLDKLMGRLDPNSQDLVRYGYFSRALEGPEEARSINPQKLSTLWKDLGPNQKKVLVPEKSHREQFDNFSNLTSKNAEAFRLMFNPKTGARLAGALTLGNLAKAPLGIAMRPVVNKLTSEEYRTKLINKMIESSKKNK